MNPTAKARRGARPTALASSRLSLLAGAIVATALAAALPGCSSDDEASTTEPVAVLSAFPAELAAVLERTSVEDTVTINDRTFRIGTLGGVPVIVGMTGIGLVNATETTRTLLANFAVRGIVISGVAGSFLRIGDVAVPSEWALADGTSYAVDADWLALASEVAESGVELESCTVPPRAATPMEVCLAEEPIIAVGGKGVSSDMNNGNAFPCQPTSDDVFGCDVAAPRAAGAAPPQTGGVAGDEELASEDMESAAIAAEAVARGVHFIAFRAVSDGAGDPQNLPGFPFQFFAYYRLAANNAAATAAAFIERLGRG